MPRALISVSDKTGVVPFATRLAELGWELISTGGTSRALREAGLAPRDVADVTGFPEILDGRVKTLHPAIHGGLLARRNSREHMDALRQHHITPIDLVVVNLYPFRETASRKDVAPHDVVPIMATTAMARLPLLGIGRDARLRARSAARCRRAAVRCWGGACRRSGRPRSSRRRRTPVG